MDNPNALIVIPTLAAILSGLLAVLLYLILDTFVAGPRRARRVEEQRRAGCHCAGIWDDKHEPGCPAKLISEAI